MMILDREPDAEIHTAGSAQDAVELVRREGDNTDLLILDLSMPGVTGTELMEEIVRIQPMLKILSSRASSTSRASCAFCSLALRASCRSRSTPTCSRRHRLVLKGGVFIPSKLLAESSVRAFSIQAASLKTTNAEEPVHLTERQKDVLMLLAQGAPIKRICRDLNLSEGTVKTHVAAIYRASALEPHGSASRCARAGFDIDLKDFAAKRLKI